MTCHVNLHQMNRLSHESGIDLVFQSSLRLQQVLALTSGLMSIASRKSLVASFYSFDCISCSHYNILRPIGLLNKFHKCFRDETQTYYMV